MLVVLDTSFWLLALDEGASSGTVSGTNEAIAHAKARVDGLLNELARTKAVVLVPTPVIAELFSRDEAGMGSYLALLRQSANFRTAAFDERAAVELAALNRKAYATGDKRAGATGSWQKIKIDRQIISIAKIHGASTIFTNDEQLAAAARLAEIDAISLAEVPIPEADRQYQLSFGSAPRSLGEPDSEPFDPDA